MRKIFYPKIAWTDIRKNKQLYTPYNLTCIGIISIFYIITSLSQDPLLEHMSGGGNLKVFLTLGRYIVGLFALFFLFYTNSFLIRRRKKEFGLYNILGMDKKNISRILLWETLITSGISLGIGLLGGIILSKIAELGLFNIIKEDISYSLSVNTQAILHSVVLFAVIFMLILLNTLRQVRLSNPITLLRSENNGEKPPKANWILAVLGIIILGVAYYMAVTIKNPLSAIGVFFIAVLLVIVATYLLFIAGSVAFCRILQKNKNYYYKPHRFVSISSMVYRMKRNGAGLASICILSTMVLVMISSTFCLYTGTEDSMRKRYPRDIALTVIVNKLSDLNDENIAIYHGAVNDAVGNQPIKDVIEYKSASDAGYFENGYINTDPAILKNNNSYDGMYQFFIIPLSEYNRHSGLSETLQANEAFIYKSDKAYAHSTIKINNSETLHIKKVLPDLFEGIFENVQLIPSICIVIPDFDEFVGSLIDEYQEKNEDEYSVVRLKWYYGFNSDITEDDQSKILRNSISNLSEIYEKNKNTIYSYYGEGIAGQRSDFYTTYGGLFFLGIMLSIVFIFATVLIIYYKQVSEGQEDRSRFDIMQNVGMTKKEIRKSINSQVLTVFFLPLVFAGSHLIFAFPMIWKLLQLFDLQNQPLLIIVTIISFLIFASFYAMVYKMTANVYYNIVSGQKQR